MKEGARLGPAERIDRARARAWVLQVQYRWESTGRVGTLLDALAETRATRSVAVRRLPYITEVLTHLQDNFDAVEEALQAALDNWRLERLSRIDRAILRQGAAELLFMDSVPPKVALQEAIRLAEAYGGQDSPRFVNGVLDALYHARIGT
jgi:N utilization substance protein B